MESLRPSCPLCVSLEYLCHVYVRNDSLAGVVIADSEYPSRVAFTLLEKVSVYLAGLDLGGRVGLGPVTTVPEASGWSSVSTGSRGQLSPRPPQAPPWHRFLPCAQACAPGCPQSPPLFSGTSPWVSCGCALPCVTQLQPCLPSTEPPLRPFPGVDSAPRVLRFLHMG